MIPEDLMVQLKSTTHRRSHRTLDAIFEICSEHKDNGETDFSYSTIARIGAKRGIPTAQSIRNKTGEPYQLLINCFKESLDIKNKKQFISSESWIEKITDPKLKLLVKVQEAELKKTKAQLKEIIPPPRAVTVYDYSEQSAESRLTPCETKALEYLLSDDFFKDHTEFCRGNRADLFDISGQQIFKPGTFSAIKKALQRFSF